MEKVYEKALVIELTKLGLDVRGQVPVKVYYDGNEVGSYFADLIVNNTVIIELKSCDGFIEEHEAQLTNYLKSTKIEIGLLLNFGVKPQVKRKVFSNQYKSL